MAKNIYGPVLVETSCQYRKQSACRNEIIYFFTNSHPGHSCLYERRLWNVRFLKIVPVRSAIRKARKRSPCRKRIVLAANVLCRLFYREKKHTQIHLVACRLPMGWHCPCGCCGGRSPTMNQPVCTSSLRMGGHARAGRQTDDKYQNKQKYVRTKIKRRTRTPTSNGNGRRDETGHAVRSTRRVYARRVVTRTRMRTRVMVAVLCGCKHLRPLPCDRPTAAALPRAPRSPLRVLLLYGRPSKSPRNRSGGA